MSSGTDLRHDAARAVAAGRKPRRWGAWYVAEHRFRVMRSYTATVVVAGIGSPLIYLYALGVGLATIVDGSLGADAVDGVSYLVFVAPALLASAAITVASEEFTYPIMLGYKWNPTFAGMHAAPIRPQQVADGVVISVAVRMLVNTVLFFVLMLVFGAVPSPMGFLAVPVAVLTGLAFGAVLMAYTSTLEEDTGQLAMVMRFLVLPMTLFSGTFFPLTVLPIWLQWIGWISPLWHGTELARVFTYGYPEPIWLTVVHVAYLAAMLAVGWVWARRIAVRRLGEVTGVSQHDLAPASLRFRPARSLYAGNARAVMFRGWRATRSTNWLVMVSGFFEPIFYLLAMGIGLGALVGDVTTESGLVVPYAAFIAPALLAVAAMNGAIYDSTWNVFFKMQFARLYEGMLSTSLGPLDVALGEIMLALLRGALYAVGFQFVMQVLGLNLSWLALLAVPAVLLIAFGFASLGMAITSYMKTFQQMDWINFVMLPMFLFSATFYPITVYPQWLQIVIQALPLWHGVELVRGLTTGDVDWGMLWHVLYYVVMIAIGLVFTTKRLRALFLD